MSVELHLPDLPEVPISLGPVGVGRKRTQLPWHLRLRDTFASFLPVLVMALLALASWWLVKNSPRTGGVEVERPLSAEPDYTMTQFVLQRFAPDGHLKLRIEGARMRHFPATDRIEIEDARIRAVGDDGRLTLAHARQAVANGDGSEVQLLGGAEVTSTDPRGGQVLMQSEFLHAFLVTEKVKSHRPVLVRGEGTELRAAGLDYDYASGRLELAGPMRAVLAPRAAPAARVPQ